QSIRTSCSKKSLVLRQASRLTGSIGAKERSRSNTSRRSVVALTFRQHPILGGSTMSEDFEVNGTNKSALFTMKLHRGEGMALIAMNWKKNKPPKDFVGFAIEYKEPKGDKFFALKNRVAFPGLDGSVNPNQMSTRLSPIQ